MYCIVITAPKLLVNTQYLRTMTANLLSKLIAFDSTSCNSNLDLISFIANYLEDHHIQSELVHDSSGQKANLFATVSGPQDVPGLVLSGHTDVVPVTDQDWTKPPFELTVEDNLLYGRGSSDMKGFIAVCLALVPFIQNANLKQPIHFAFSYDEEVGCIGVRTLLDQLKTREIIPSACIVGEPTCMQTINAHKGKISQRCHVHGHACHSSRIDEGLNAVEYAAQIITYLHELSLRIEDGGPFDEAFAPSYTSVHTGPVHGGTALNIVPEYCTFDFEFRNIPQHDAGFLLQEVKDYAIKSLLPRMKKKNLNAQIEFESLSEIPAFNAQPEDSLTQLCLSLSPIDTTGKISFGTEAGLFQQLGMQAIVCGPGDINQAHKPDEFIDGSQLSLCESFLKNMVINSTTSVV